MAQPVSLAVHLACSQADVYLHSLHLACSLSRLQLISLAAHLACSPSGFSPSRWQIVSLAACVSLVACVSLAACLACSLSLACRPARLACSLSPCLACSPSRCPSPAACLACSMSRLRLPCLVAALHAFAASSSANVKHSAASIQSMAFRQPRRSDKCLYPRSSSSGRELIADCCPSPLAGGKPPAPPRLARSGAICLAKPGGSSARLRRFFSGFAF